MRLSTSLNVLFDPPAVTAQATLDRLAAAGFRVLDLNFSDWLFSGSPLLGQTWAAWIAGLRARADALGLVFSQEHGPMFDPLPNSAKTRRMFELSHRSLEAAAMLGIPWVVFHPATFPGAWDASHLRRLRERNLDWLAPLVVTAERAGTGIALENLVEGRYMVDSRRCYCAAPVELVELIDAFSSPRVGACWDTGHGQLMRLNQGAALRALGGRLKATHVQDNDGEVDQHLLPFLGQVDWKAVMGGLRAIDYAGDFTYEVHNYVRHRPDCLRDSALRLMRETGEYLLAL